MTTVHNYLDHYRAIDTDENTRAQLAAEAIAQFLVMREGLTRKAGSDMSNATINDAAATLTAAVIAATWQKDIKRVG